MTTEKADTGNVAGNQTANTPDVDGGELRDQGWKGADTGKLPGGQTRNTPGKDESKARKR